MSSDEIKLKGLSPEQVSNLLPEGLISLCWRGSVAHGMPLDGRHEVWLISIDDKDVMGVYIGPLEHYIGFGREDVYEKWEGEWDWVFYELKKFTIVVNPRIREEYENGREYYALHGRPLAQPQNLLANPSIENLTYHAEHVFKG